eukprot:403359976
MEGLMTIYFPKSIGIPSSDLYQNVTQDLAFKIIFSSKQVESFVNSVAINDFTKQKGYDNIQLTFKDNRFFKSNDFEIEENLQISSQIPPQSSNSTFFLGVSLKQIWSLLNTLQIITHIPLLGITIPSNLMICLQTIIDISNVKIIPKELTDYIFRQYDQTTKSSNDAFSQLDIF